MDVTASTSPGTSQCMSCGACCATSRFWPRFTMESDEQIARIPDALISANGSGMACDGNRCKALSGEVGKATLCTIYAVRPDVCIACEPGDDACSIARRHHGMPPIEHLPPDPSFQS